MSVPSRIPVRLALQGGGALGAYSAGVLDVLLASRRLDLTHFSGTSAGALNAVVCASALATGGRKAARQALSSFWQSLASSSIDDYLVQIWGPFGQSLRKSFGEWLWNSALAMPNIYGGSLLPAISSTPLRSILEEHVDLKVLRALDAPRVFITLTNVRTGLPRVISNADLTLDAILASACLPQYFRAVEFDEGAFWDGGFTGNPTLWPLIRARGPTDILLVQLSRNPESALPSSAAAVSQRMSEIVFQSSLVAEMQAIQAIRELMETAAVPADRETDQEETNLFRQARFHRIGPPPNDLLCPGASSDRSPRNLEALRAAGRNGARQYLMRDGKQIGLKETLDIRASFTDEGMRLRAITPARSALARGEAQVQSELLI